MSTAGHSAIERRSDPAHHGLFATAPRHVALVIVLVITGGLWIDARFGWPGQCATIVWTFLVFAWLYRRSSATERRVLVLCTIISGIGEVFLSLVWGLYDYQFHNVPLFVPPGHALLMTLGLITIRIVPRWCVGLVVVAAIGWGVHAWTANSDRFGVVLCALFFIAVTFGKARVLYATMFVLALIMELYGTALGNWRWLDIAPWTNLTQANPPFSAGAFYGVLDLLVLNALALWQRRTPARAIQTQAPAGVPGPFQPERRAEP
ncbi:MAG: hypothetical protein JNK75_04645 [Betaproteobacteria bacterium]|nr:hypothetical protein [Betaproteobacteria bacterium]